MFEIDSPCAIFMEKISIKLPVTHQMAAFFKPDKREVFLVAFFMGIPDISLFLR